MNLKVAVALGSDSDLPLAKKAFRTLEDFGIEYKACVLSAHRTPDRAAEFARGAREAGFGVIVAFAGMSAALAGALAAHTTLPVIGVPCPGAAAGGLGGLDALLSTVQMPTGVPVATVAIGGGANAAILAAQILSLSDAGLAEKLSRHKMTMEADAMEKNTTTFDEGERGL
ncbi:MAG: 5-(carboxyamino)imidazole ribonucleotide mutase [Spirochaetaceae bacterium]|nr:5-(carboxyamino)imidazole ribonucleotide mutase [Spirochaetaceae bacterium]